MRELVIDLKRSARSKSADLDGGAPTTVARPQRRFGVVAAGLVSGVALTMLATWLVRRPDVPTSNPLEGAKFARVTDFEGAEFDADISEDGRLVVFLSDRDAGFDVWVTQLGTGQFINLTKRRIPELLSDFSRNVGFLHDTADVWLRKQSRSPIGRLLTSSLWLFPTLGGQERPLLDPAVAMAVSPDGSRIAYHTFAPGDPIFVADRTGSNPRQIYVATEGLHCHYPAWSPDGRFVYFVRGLPAGGFDIWRVPSTGGEAERLTFHNSTAGYPTALDERTLLYVATAEDGSGSWLYTLDLQRRQSRRVSLGVEQYLSIDATRRVAGKPTRLVATVANPSVNLWSVPVGERIVDDTAVTRLTVPTVRASAPRVGPEYLVYLSREVVVKDSGSSRETSERNCGMQRTARSPRRRRYRRTAAASFPVRQQGRATLHVMNANGTGVQRLAESLDVRGAVSWSPDGRWITLAANGESGPRVFKVPVDGQAPVQLVDSLSLNPVWSPDGEFIVYGGPDVGGVFPLKAITPNGQAYPLPDLTLRRGAERFCFLPKSRTLVTLQGEFWNRRRLLVVNLEKNSSRQLTWLRPGYMVNSFDISPDGRRIIFDRVRENSDIVLIDLPPR